MFGLGMSEMVLIGIVALIVTGPKDFIGLFRTIGQFTGKARGMAREFSRAMEAAADDAGVKDISKTIKAAANPQKFGADKIKEATGMTKAPELSQDRAEAAQKMSDSMAKAATDRKAREAAEELAATAPDTAPKGDA